MPDLSVVVTARNDDYGGDLQHRIQVFADALAQGCLAEGLGESRVMTLHESARIAATMDAIRDQIDR